VTLLRPVFMQAGGGDATFSYDAINFRNMLRALIRSEGILTPDVVAGGLKVTQRGAGANFSVDVAAGRAAIMGDDVTDQGVYIVRSDATVNLTIPSPPGSGTQVHRVVAQVRDKLHNGTYTTYDWDLEVLPDTGSGTPALPASAISLARVSVSAGQSSVTDANITDDRTTANLVTAKLALVDADSSRPPNPYDSEKIYRTDKDCEEIADAGAWWEIPRRGGGGSAWTTWTPTLTAVTTNPSVGTGATRTGAYFQVGKMVTARGTVRFGTSGSSAGSGIYEVSLPVTAKSLSPGRQQGSATAFSHAGDFVDGAVFIESGATTKARLSIDSTVVTNSSPWTWTNNDQFDFTITYEAA
jgi:hypothetical protein